jgi:predicted O-methyltransferase YrrM
VTPGELLISILDGFYSRRPSSSYFNIIETGCIRLNDVREDLPIGHGMEGAGWSTLYLAKWVEAHAGTAFISCELNQDHIDIAKEVLGPLCKYAHFTCGESVPFIESLPGAADFAYLDSYDDPEHGFAEFLACEKRRVPFVVMDDFRSKCLMAYAYALGKGYKVSRNHRYTVIECNYSAMT